MKPIALISIIGFLALGGFACAPPPPPAPPPPRIAQVCTDGVLNPVPFLKVPFYPKPPYEQSPEPDSASINPEIQSDLTAAFEAAPKFFKDQLCSLDGIYINPTGCTGYDPSTCSSPSDADTADNSWAFRQPSRKRYIALSLGLWKNNPCDDSTRKVCAPRFQTYQTKRLLALLGRTAEKKPDLLVSDDQKPRLSLPAYEVSSDAPALSVLAALAHEFGHLLWWDVFVEPGSERISNTATFCNGRFYPSGAWQGSPVNLPPYHWISFGQIRLQPKDSDVLQLQRFLLSGRYREAFDRLHRIYSNRRWASALAAFSPDEDFVETFELLVLIKAGLSQVSISTQGRAKYSDYVVRNASVAPLLQTKLQCMEPLSQPRRPL